MTPNPAKKEGKTIMVSFNLWNNAKNNRQYPEIKVGDEVRVIQRRIPEPKGTCQNGQMKFIK
jgi:hypothetical protein